MTDTFTDPETVRAIAENPNFHSVELFTKEAEGHQFKAGDMAILHGLEDYPEFNGSTVEITAIREDGMYGMAYYIRGDINKLVNWIYEYRLQLAP